MVKPNPIVVKGGDIGLISDLGRRYRRD